MAEERTREDLSEQEEQQLGYHEKLIAQVQEIAEMTDTSAWRKIYGYMLEEIDLNTKALRTVEKMPDVIRHQQTINAYEELVRKIRVPLESLNSQVKECPLFAGLIRYRSVWDEKTGVAELVELEQPLEAPDGEAETADEVA